MKFEILSDLHIDQWDKNIDIKYNYGIRKNNPFILKKGESNILIIAGDISDDLDLSISFLIDMTKYYDKILFVDGNHEHVNKYPELYSKDFISEKIKNRKIFYLPSNHFKSERTIFLGCCGWWDYSNKNMEVMEKNQTYFKNWIPDMDKNDSDKFISNTIENSEREFHYIENYLNNYNKDNSIDNIIVVTHTVPIEVMERKEESGTDRNSKFSEIIKNKSEKLKMWIFGHNHQQFDKIIDGTRFVSHPRGRPEDFNREIYEPKVIEFN